MEKPKSSYTEEDKEFFREYLEKHPNAKTWKTLEGLVVPCRFLKDDHVENIITHLEGRLEKWPGTQSLIDAIAEMKALKTKRLSKKSIAGKILYAPTKMS